MSETNNYTFARFWRCALQVNPASYHSAYRGAEHGLLDKEYNEHLLAKCRELDIKVVGLADHGNVANSESLRQILEKAEIVVFPGFEVSSSEKVHFVCLYSEDTSSQQLERYLGSLELLDPDDGVRPSRLSAEQIIDRVVHEQKGFIYAAHCTEDNGLLKRRLDHIWKLPDLRAAQIPDSIERLRGQEGNFCYQVLLNKDPAYKRDRTIAAINAKDIAKPDDLAHPGATCLIKMTRPTFSAFKLAFLDPESRVRLNSDQPKSTPSAIHKIKVSGGYLDGLRAQLSEHLNTVIGGRGTGKSTLLECLRFVLDIEPKGRQARAHHNEIIKANLGSEKGRVEVELTSFAQHGKRYVVSRRFGEPPIVRDEANHVSQLTPRQLMPTLDIYGHNEISELARDAGSRLRLLERFLEPNSANDVQLTRLREQLKNNAEKLVKARDDADALQEKLGRLPGMEERLRGYKELGLDKELARVPLLERERNIAARVDEELTRVRDALVALDSALPDTTFISDAALAGLPNAGHLQQVRGALDALRASFTSWIAEGQKLLQKHETDAQQARDNWETAFAAVQAEIETALNNLPARAGRSGREIGHEYQRLQHDIERTRPLQTQGKTFADLIASLEQDRRNLLADLSDLRAKDLESLQKTAKRLNRRLKGKLQVIVKPEANRQLLIQFLLQCNLEGVGERRLSWINEREELSTAALAASVRAGKEALESEWGLTPMVADALAKLSYSKIMALEALELPHQIGLELNVAAADAAEVYKPLDQLSSGQQCTAILHLLLLENHDPLIMDQPEDNLDNAFIAERIVKELRQEKTHRQFIFSTHNANIPVFGDAEWIGVISVEESRGSLAADAQGSIDVPAIRNRVAKILEGGRDAFMQRKAKYEF